MEANGWKPHLFEVYKGWHNRGSTGVIVIHIGQDEHSGSFSVGNQEVTIHYNDGYEMKEIQVPKVECKFAKHFSSSGRTRYYHIWLDKNVISKYGKTDDKKGGIMPSDETERTQGGLIERGGLRDKLTGRDDMIFIRTRYQGLLDNNYLKANRIIEYLKQVSDNTKERQKIAEGLKENIDAHMKERDRAHTNLQNLLNKEEKYEDKMLGKTLKGMKAKGRVTVKQKMKDVDIDTLQYGSVEQYKRLYPHYGAEIFEKITEVNKKEKEIREAQEAYNKEVSNYNYQLEIADKNILAVKDTLKVYEKAKKDGDEELKACPYYNSIFYKKLTSLKEKTLLNLDTTKHDIEGLEHQLGIIEKTFSSYTNEPLKPMKY
jgi:hypothetical protein